MQHTIDRPRSMRGGGHAAVRRRWGHGRSGAVMLVTFDHAPFHAEAVRFAVETAVESGRALVDVNAVDRIRNGRFADGDTAIAPAGESDSLRGAAELATALGVRVERLLLHSPRPASGLVALIAARRPALVVFGPDPAALRRFRRPTRRRHRRLLSTLERDAPCLLWTADEPDAAGAVSSAARPSATSAPRRSAT